MGRGEGCPRSGIFTAYWYRLLVLLTGIVYESYMESSFLYFYEKYCGAYPLSAKCAKLLKKSRVLRIREL